MAQFLRDEKIENITIDKDALEQLHQVFASRISSIPELSSTAGTKQESFLTYIIRFDNKGYRIFNLEDLITRFISAKSIERIIFTLETEDAIKNGRHLGTFMELRIDRKDPGNCYITASSDSSDWVDASYSSAVDTVKKFKNRNHLAKSSWSELVIQIFGTLLGFFVAVLGASKISPSLNIENAFLISFLLVLFLYSNTWALLNARLHALVDYAFPNIKFIRPNKDELHWIIQTLVGGIFVAVTLYLLSAVFAYLGQILGSFIAVGT